jgi:hypothetical protein
VGPANTGDANGGKRRPKIDLSKFRLGANFRKKALNEEDLAYLERQKNKKGDEQTIEDLRYKIVTYVKDLEELRRDMNTL